MPMWILLVVLHGEMNTFTILNFKDRTACEIVLKQMREKLEQSKIACIYVPFETDHDHVHEEHQEHH